MYQKLQINDFRLFKKQQLLFGKYLTVLSGRNSTGKSTILGMIANSGELKRKDGITYSARAFRAEFSELFKGSEEFDQIGPNRFAITLCNEDDTETDYRSFRTAWQTKDKYRKKQKSASIETKKETAENNVSITRDEKEAAKEYKKEERFRVIPFKKLEGNKKTEAKFNYPILYIGLSRLFPIGESQNDSITTKSITFTSEEHKKWFIEKYKSILSMQSDLREITNFSIGETDKKIGIGISTDYYDYLTNSSGQDNLGQILLALLSFKKLKEERDTEWHGGVLLIDEVDATLHPAAQNKLIKLFIQEARENQIQVIVTTHSISLLRNICQRITYNSHENTVNNGIELYYFTNATRRLEIKRNISFTEIESDLMVNSIVQNNNKIKVYTEDAEARWVLKYLIPNYLCYVDLLDVTVGCDQLINLYNADIQYFGNTLIIFDGDVKQGQLNKIPEKTRENLGNIINLPGNKRPEEVLYDYLLHLGPDHEFWSGGAQKVGFTWDYFNEHGPGSDDYQQEKERDQFKKWFVAHEQYFDSTKLMEFWMNDNPECVSAFKSTFKKAHNHVAQRMMTFTIEAD